MSALQFLGQSEATILLKTKELLKNSAKLEGGFDSTA
jgi:hypothetical protein